MRTFYSDSLRRVLETLNTDPDRGLSGQEAARRLAAYGPNQLDEAPQAGKLRQVLGQLKDPMILVLLAAAALSFFAGGGRDLLDAAIILGIVVFNTVISVSQEDNARKALEALRKLSSPKAKVLRDGGEVTSLGRPSWTAPILSPATSSGWKRGTTSPPTAVFYGKPGCRRMSRR